MKPDIEKEQVWDKLLLRTEGQKLITVDEDYLREIVEDHFQYKKEKRQVLKGVSKEEVAQLPPPVQQEWKDEIHKIEKREEKKEHTPTQEVKKATKTDGKK